MSYSHFTIEERIGIKHLLTKGVSIRQIASELGRSPSSVSREIKRNSTDKTYYSGLNYSVGYAEQFYKKRISMAHNIVRFPLEVVQIIEQRIKETWSPEQIAAFYKGQGFPCYKTIYKWINEGTIVNGNKSLLRRKGKGGWYETRGKVAKGKSIRKRDKRIYKRADYGHWELDTVVSGMGKSKACFITLVERKSRFYKAIKSPNRHADVVAKLIIDYLKQFPSELVKTITTDNGKEFAEWEQIEKELNCEVYFCDTFCAWQKGSNENSNGLLREFFPKGYNLSRYTQAYIDKKVKLINNRPRKCNNWISPSKLMSEAISRCCT